MVVVIITVIISSRGQAFVPTAVLNVKTCFPSTNSGPLTAAVIISGYDEAYTCGRPQSQARGLDLAAQALLNNGRPFPFVESAYRSFRFVVGIVAKTRECASVGPRLKWPASDRQPKQLVDKLQLGEWVTFANPPGSPLPNHVDRLDSL